MFSIIIPLYNKAPYIEKAIRSVLLQTYPDFELIVVDDGSYDNGLTQVKKINDNRITVVNQLNAGVAAARNNGAKLAKYDYIAFLDADDWWDNRFLEEMNQLIEQYPHAGIYASSYYKVKYGKNNQANVGVDSNFTKGYIDYFNVYANTLWMPVWTGATVIPKLIFEQEEGFKSQLKLGEDFDLWVRIALKNKVAYTNKPLSYYNQDVELKDKAVVSGKLHPKEQHFIFNLDYLADKEKSNVSLKRLLDALRLYILFPYFINSKRRKDAKNELKKIDWKKQPLAVRIKYHCPVILLKIYNFAKTTGSKVKRKLK